MKRVILTLSERQAYAIKGACELAARLHMGQIKEIEWEIEYPETENRQHIWDICNYLKMLMFPDLLPNSYYSLTSPQIPDIARILYDIKKVIEFTLAGPRPPGGFPLVIYDPPMRTSQEEELPKCEKI